MAITLLQPNSFMFDERAVINKFPVGNRLGIDCVLECIDKKLTLSDKLEHHVLFLKGRTGSGKSTCLPSRLFKHMDTNKGEKMKVVINVVEPRVLLAKSISQDNCDNEPYLKFGINTGYNTGAGKTDISGASRLVYMTTELFRMKLSKGLSLGDVVIIDECHILDRPTITTLHEIKKYLYSNDVPIAKKPLFIFASATLNLDLMINYFFGKSEITERSMSKFSVEDVYRDALMINYITGLRNFDVKEEYISDSQEQLFKKDEREFVRYIMTEGIEKSIKSKEVWKGLPARDILIFSYGMGFNKLFEVKDGPEVKKDGKRDGKKDGKKDGKMSGGVDDEIDEIERDVDRISKELEHYLHSDLDDEESNDEYLSQSSTLTGADIQKECKYPVYISTMKYDDSQEVKEWRKTNEGKFRVLILPYGATCKGFASQLLANAYDPDPDSQQFEIKIYISTDAIETGKTVNTWYQVYDTGLRLSKIMNPLVHNPREKQFLTRHPITQSASIQRCGRVGRKCPGISVRVFTKATWDKMMEDQLPDNINLVSISQLVIECRSSDFADCVKNNDYIQPNSFDTNLMTGRDLVCSGYTTPWGEFINDVRDYREPAAPWVLKAEEFYYINNADLFETLVMCRCSRNNISDLVSAPSFEKTVIPTDMEAVDNATVLAIYEARQEYVKFLTGNSKIFKTI